MKYGNAILFSSKEAMEGRKEAIDQNLRAEAKRAGFDNPTLLYGDEAIEFLKWDPNDPFLLPGWTVATWYVED